MEVNSAPTSPARGSAGLGFGRHDTASLWHKFREELRAFVRRRIATDEAADDILQAAYLRAHEAIADGRGPKDPRAWLYQIVRRVLFDTYRANERQKALHRDFEEQPLFDREAEPNADKGADEEAFLIIARALPGFIASLDGPYREALELTELEGLSHSEAAARAGVSLSCMKSRVLRGKKQLLDALDRCCSFEFDGRGKPIECYERESGMACRTCG